MTDDWKPSEMPAGFVPGEMHPIQINRGYGRDRAQVSSYVTMRAYEVYSAVHGEQVALIDLKGRDCRGGFSDGELIAFLYARTFPKDQWRDRVDEALNGMRT